MKDSYDLIVIGAGVVGCAIAARLHRLNVLVLERNASSAEETSRRNSGVIHSGIHLNPGFMKARLVAEGKHLVVDHCQRVGTVPIKQVGMHIVAATEDVAHMWSEIQNLRNMLKRAKKLGVSCHLISGRELRVKEPAVRSLFALYIPENCIIDPVAFVRSLESQAKERGVEFRFNESVRRFTVQAQSIEVETDQGCYRGQVIVNATGLAADEVAALAGYQYRQVFYRGEYYEVLPRSGIMVSSLVYPVHRPGKAGLGVHITPTIDGRLLLGPNAKAIERRDNYETDKTPAEGFYSDVRAFLPDLRVEDLRWAYSGIRPKLATGRAENDFLVNFDCDPIPMVNLIGIESPGLTASMALAQFVEQGIARTYF